MTTSLRLDEIRSLCALKTQQAIPHWVLFPSVPSTHRYLITQAHMLEPGTLCIAEQQTQGQGRMGRSWNSPPHAGLYFSYYKPLKTNYSPHVLGLVTALSLAHSLRALHVPCAIKWPNDIWVSHAKLAGVLVELLPGQRAVFSIGLNVQFPPELRMPGIIDLATIWKNPQALMDRATIMAKILDDLCVYLPLFEKEGFEPFYAMWPSYDMLLHQRVTIQTASTLQEGIARGITMEGALEVDIGTQRISFSNATAQIRPWIG